MESPIGSNVDPQELLDTEETIHFTNSINLRHAIADFSNDAWDRDSLCDHTILIMGIPENVVDYDDTPYNNDEDNEPRLPRHGKILYLKDLQALFITMPGTPHERASSMFARLVDRKIEAMNCEDEFCPVGRARMEMGSVKKEPDASWTPDGKTYTTLAVEAGVSESERALALDAKIWLESKESHVTQLVVIKVSRTRAEIRFSVWKAIPREGDTRAEYTRKATEVQRVDVTLAQERPVTNGRISLSFKELLERNPRLGTAEKDLELSARELGGVARKVWEDMGFVLPHR
jgi:hypothetical protein